MADLEALRCERAWAAVDEVVALERCLREEGTALSDLPHPVIGRCADAERPLLVALRRAVFQGRRPGGRVWSAREECRAAFGSQSGQRAAAVPRVLDHPGEGPDGRPLTGLWGRHDPASGRVLLCDDRGRQVRPPASGTLVGHALPPALRFPVAVFGEPLTAFAPDPHWDGVGRHAPVAHASARLKRQSDAEYVFELSAAGPHG